jgi:hypothetical protein
LAELVLFVDARMEFIPEFWFGPFHRWSSSPIWWIFPSLISFSRNNHTVDRPGIFSAYPRKCRTDNLSGARSATSSSDKLGHPTRTSILSWGTRRCGSPTDLFVIPIHFTEDRTEFLTIYFVTDLSHLVPKANDLWIFGVQNIVAISAHIF